MPVGKMSLLGYSIFPSNFGHWPGPGYCGGMMLPDGLDQDGKIFQALYFGGTYTLSNVTYKIPAVAREGFLDAVGRTHDLGYEYAARMYGKSTAGEMLTQYVADLDSRKRVRPRFPFEGYMLGVVNGVRPHLPAELV